MESLRDPKVSIVTPTYNYAKYCAELIESVMAQTYPQVEHVIVDDGSTDNTQEVLAPLLQRWAPRLRIIYQQNAGQAVAVNRGLLAATGDILLWINSDDLLAPWAVEEGIEAFRKCPDAAAVYGDWGIVDATGNLLETMKPGPATIDQLLLANFAIANCSLFIRKSILHDVGVLDPVLRYTLDWDYVVRIALRHKIVYSPSRPWSYYRDHSTTKSRSGQIAAAGEYGYIYDRVLRPPAATSSIAGLRRRAQSRARWQSAICYGHGGAFARAGVEALRSFLADPLPFLRKSQYEPYSRFRSIWRQIHRHIAPAN